MDARGVLGSRRAQEDGAETAPDLLGGEDLDGVDVGVAVGGGGVDFDGGRLAGFEAEGAERDPIRFSIVAGFFWFTVIAAAPSAWRTVTAVLLARFSCGAVAKRTS
jgi:hypothetical protein